MRYIFHPAERLRQEKRAFIAQTLSREYLIKKFGITKTEVAKIKTVTKYGVERYEKFTVWYYLKYGE